MPKKVRETARIPLGNYRGLGFGIVLHSLFAPDVYLEGPTIYMATLSRDHQWPRAVLNAVERLAGGYGLECDRVERDLGIANRSFVTISPIWASRFRTMAAYPH